MNSGDIIDNHYQLKRPLGRGSFGEVWLATDTFLGHDVALKFYVAMDNNGRQEFRDEYSKVFRLRHENLLTPSHYAEWNGQPYLELEYCPASAAAQLGKLNEQQLWCFIADVAAGLAYMHGSNPTIVHQDIKPANILRKTDGHFAITDFGISVSLRSTMLRQSGREASSSVGGSIPYMGPELFGAKPVPIMASDVWALGVTIYEMATGELPFMGQGGIMLKNGAELPILDDFSPELNKLTQCCLALNTWDRPTAETLASWATDHTKIQIKPIVTQSTDSTQQQKKTAELLSNIEPNELNVDEKKSKLNKHIISLSIICAIAIILLFAIVYLVSKNNLNSYNKELEKFHFELKKASVTNQTHLDIADSILIEIKAKENALFNFMITPHFTELQRELDARRNELQPQLQISHSEINDDDGEGGYLDIKVTTNDGGYTAISNQEWCKIAKKEDELFRIELDENSSGVVRNAIIKVKTPMGCEKDILVTQNITIVIRNIEMVYVEGGTFTMGASEQDDKASRYEKPAHRVYVKGYYIGKYEVTQGLWYAVMRNVPFKFVKGREYPVENVSWDECQEFIRKLNKITGKKYRLPTEAEWEFAARGGNKSRGYKYSGSNNIDEVAWYGGFNGKIKSTQPVGKKKNNELGIFDMCGNVQEWCSDGFELYSNQYQSNPKGSPTENYYRVVRGGCWLSTENWDTRTSIRGKVGHSTKQNTIGFRLAMDK